MPVLRLATLVRAPAEVCFDLARDVTVHMESAAGTREVAVAGVTKGLMNLGDEVTWEATHFGVRQRLTSRITAFDRPRHFRDSQVVGAFQRFDHDHIFHEREGATLMEDVFDYQSPLGVFGRLADRLFLAAYMRAFLEKRAEHLRQAAEAYASRGRK